jgi:hypothetical protein
MYLACSTSVIVLLLFGALLYLGDFSGRQSAVLATIGGLIWLFVLTAEKPPFVPYSLSIEPKFRQIVRDFELAADSDEAWANVCAQMEKAPQAPWNIWYSGFGVSVIAPLLIYEQACKRFVSHTEMILWAELSPVNSRNMVDCVHVLPREADLLLKSLLFGFGLSIRISHEHWEKVRNSEALKHIKETDARTDHQTMRVEIKLAVIPFEECDAHFWMKYVDIKAFSESEVRRRVEARARYGWKGQAQRTREGLETPAEHSNVIEHRYFVASHSIL